MAKHYYFFDGYNLIYAEPQLKELLNEDLTETRCQLTEKILNFLGSTENSCGILVFDGPNLSFSSEVYSEQLEIYYGKTADTIIEKIAKGLAAHSQITLVSSDNTIYNAILPTEGLVTQIKAQEFWRQAENTQKKFSSQQRNDPLLADRLDNETRNKLNELRKG